MGNELLGASFYVSSQLLGSAGLAAVVSARVYEDEAPDTDPEDAEGDPPAYPLVLFHRVSHRSILSARGSVVAVRALYRVRVIGVDGYSALAAAAAAAHTALLSPTPTPMTLSGTTFQITCHREEPFMDSGSEDGVMYYNLGGDYRLFVKTA